MKRVAMLRTFCMLFCLLAIGYSNAQNIYAGRYKASFTGPPRMAPTGKVPDAPLAGNGDIGLTLGGTPDQLSFYLGKNDFWRAWPVYPGGGIAFPGALQVNIKALKGASWYAEQVMDKAAIQASFSNGQTKVSLHTWVAATQNTVVAEFTASEPCQLQLKLWGPKAILINNAGTSHGVQWVTRSFKDTALLEWPCDIAIAMKVLGASVVNNEVTLLPGKKIILTLTLFTNFDHPQWKAQAIKTASALTAAGIEKKRMAHERWWQQFWSRSTVQFGDPYLEKYYYASQYLLACASRGNKFAPGIWGPFITKDSTSWGGDYHLNYNYQAPYWGHTLPTSLTWWVIMISLYWIIYRMARRMPGNC
ncbi:glycosyl hydrolase family 95 catalytic domain-containing protein [Paraflavitalea speifideaquila]|uniref:glycosyl hydrolase family 95 catalytic domain-containing protein n=1 Tax=Paraflavitalea speifideaquila TaxID=3076558 RepID=UPI0028EC3C48|nr:hypothetical protein [Paraflavitalea speifideiaquila]